MKKAFVYSLKHSLPIFVSFVPVGLVYGILMCTAGYNWLWSGFCSIAVFAGSLQYLMIDFFTGNASYLTVAVMALLLNSRHIFYGLPFIEKWSGYGGWKGFLIYAFPDETFSLHVSNDFRDKENEKWVFVFNAALVLFYWIFLSCLGGLVGSLISFPTAGMDFALTALFIVIVTGQLEASDSPVPAIVAAASSIVCLLVLGPAYFILPSLAVTVAVLMLLRGRLEATTDD